MRRIVIATATALAFTATSVGAAALACGNSYRHELVVETTNIVSAEGLLDKGMYRAAINSALVSFSDLGTKVERLPASAPQPRSRAKAGAKAAPRRVVAHNVGERARALQVVATAVVRLDGQVDLEAPLDAERVVTEKVRVAQLQWAAGQLAALDERTPEVPTLQARSAEAMAKVGDLDGALRVLETLSDADLMPDAHAWLTMAQLYEGKREVAKRESALTRCRTQAIDAKMCKVTADPGHG